MAVDMEIWSIVAVVLLAVLVGATLPVLFQFQSTLRSSRRLLNRLDEGLRPALKDFEEVTGRLNRLAKTLEESTPDIKATLEAVGGLGQTVNDVRKSLLSAASLGGTLAPVVAAAVQAFRGSCDDACPTEEASDRREAAGEPPSNRE